MSLRALFIAAARVVLILSVTLVILIMVLERRFIFFPTREMAETPAGPFEDASFEAIDGTRLHGWWLPAENSSQALIVSHGNAGNIGRRVEAGEFLRRELAVNVLMYDYRGYGQSQGDPTEEGTYSDIRGAYRYVRSRGFEPSAIIVMGQSLGTAVTVDLAANETVGGVLLEAPFTSIPAMARELYWPLPIAWLLSTKYDSLSKITRIKAPVAIIHATRDAIVPYAFGRELYEAAKPPKEFFEVRANVHEGSLMALGLEELRRLRVFLRLELR
jgi:fermentation-respiration switch protein FrsA (DUF1100 family)